MLLIAEPIHQYLYWLLFAYFGGIDVLSSSKVGVMNWISLFVVRIFSIDMVIKTLVLTFNSDYYINYVKKETQNKESQSVSVNDNIKLII